MMSRTLLALTAIAIGVTAAVAQEDPIKARKDVMDTFAKPFYGVLGRTARGQLPYDQAKVDEAINAIAAEAPKIQAAFQTRALAEKKSDYDASPKVWDNKADFDAKAANLVKVVSENKNAAKDLNTMKTVLGNIDKACDSCHETYRVKNR
jgi:cytochrome c556